MFSSDKGAVYVARYNTLTYTYDGGVVFGGHGVQRGGTPASPTWVTMASMGFELYGNKITNTVGDTYLMGAGAGRLMGFTIFLTTAQDRMSRFLYPTLLPKYGHQHVTLVQDSAILPVHLMANDRLRQRRIFLTIGKLQMVG